MWASVKSPIPRGSRWGSRDTGESWLGPRRQQTLSEGRKLGQSRSRLFRSGGTRWRSGAPISPDAPGSSKDQGRPQNSLGPRVPSLAGSDEFHLPEAKSGHPSLGCFGGERKKDWGAPHVEKPFVPFAGPYGVGSINYRSFLINNRLI